MWNRAAWNSMKAFVRIGRARQCRFLDEALSAQMTLGDQRAVLRTP
jgi:hypothetical protein